jgi:BTB/POZ domain
MIYSLLAALCKAKSPPVSRDATGAFFLDRDWWIFRYILQFLRSGALPQDSALLQEMHTEAAFYRMGSLRRAIEAK